MDETTAEAIARLMLEMEETRAKLKTVKDQLKDVMEQNDEYRESQDQLKDLKVKQGEAKKLLQADKDYQVVNAEADELKFKMKDLQEILSHHLVTYYNETQNTQIKSGDGEVRQIIISAKISRPEADISTD